MIRGTVRHTEDGGEMDGLASQAQDVLPSPEERAARRATAHSTELRGRADVEAARRVLRREGGQLPMPEDELLSELGIRDRVP